MTGVLECQSPPHVRHGYSELLGDLIECGALLGVVEDRGRADARHRGTTEADVGLDEDRRERIVDGPPALGDVAPPDDAIDKGLSRMC